MEYKKTNELKQKVVQSNSLIKNIQRDERDLKGKAIITRESFVLSSTEKKLVCYMLSKIKPTDTEFKPVTLNFADFCRLMKIEKGGRTYKEIHNAIIDLSMKSFCVEIRPKRFKYFRWLDSGAEVDEETKEIEIKFDHNLKGFLLSQSEKFTMFELGYIVNLQSKYAHRLYEYLHSNINIGHYKIPIETFRKEIIDGDKYKDKKDLIKRVILPALKEINEFTDIEVSFSEIKKYKNKKTHNPTTHFSFKIREKDEIEKQCLWYDLDVLETDLAPSELEIEAIDERTGDFYPNTVRYDEEIEKEIDKFLKDKNDEDINENLPY